VRHVPEMPDVPDAGTGLRAVNSRLRELLAERDELICPAEAAGLVEIQGH
jgi:hypothetical protein